VRLPQHLGRDGDRAVAAPPTVEHFDGGRKVYVKIKRLVLESLTTQRS